MPTIYFSTDGKRPGPDYDGERLYTQRGPGLEVTHAEIDTLFAGQEMRYAGVEAPSINPDRRTDQVKNVVVEVRDSEASETTRKVGFYLVVGARPNEVEAQLRQLRKNEAEGDKDSK
jgi:hypothetical protein